MYPRQSPGSAAATNARVADSQLPGTSGRTRNTNPLEKPRGRLGPKTVLGVHGPIGENPSADIREPSVRSLRYRRESDIGTPGARSSIAPAWSSGALSRIVLAAGGRQVVTRSPVAGRLSDRDPSDAGRIRVATIAGGCVRPAHHTSGLTRTPPAAAEECSGGLRPGAMSPAVLRSGDLMYSEVAGTADLPSRNRHPLPESQRSRSRRS
jgi:hypothetical protein